MRSQAAAQESAASPARRAPLRAVLSREVVDDRLIERLACGHTHEVRPGLMGTKLSPRRRCMECLEIILAEAAIEEAATDEEEA